MATFKNPENAKRVPSVFQQHTLCIVPYEFDLSASYASGAEAAESLIEVGIVPPDCVLVPEHCLLDIPQLDTNGVPTGDYEIGTEADTDALKASAAAETAAVLFGEDWNRPTTAVGGYPSATSIVIRVVNAIATLGTGTIRMNLAFRAARAGIDS